MSLFPNMSANGPSIGLHELPDRVCLTMAIWCIIALCPMDTGRYVLASDADWRSRCEQGSRVVDAAEMFRWCGARCLARISSEFQKAITYGEIHRQCEKVQVEDGVLRLSDLAVIGQQLGIGVSIVDCRPEWLFDIGVPAIVVQNTRYVDKSTGSPVFHAIVLLQVTANGCRIYDPAEQPSEFEITRSDFLKSWSGKALICRDAPASLPYVAPNWIRWVSTSVLSVNICIALVCIVQSSMRNRSKRLVGMFILGAACHGCWSDRPASNQGLLRFEESSYEFNADEISRRGLTSNHLQHSFRFTNVHSHPVIVKKVDASCSCTVPQFATEAVAPGESGEVTLLVDLTSRRGLFRSTANVLAIEARTVSDSNIQITPVTATIQLTLDALIIPPTVVSPDKVVFPPTYIGDSSVKEVVVRTVAREGQEIPALTWKIPSKEFECKLMEAGLSTTAAGTFAMYRAEVKYSPTDVYCESTGEVQWQFGDGRESAVSRLVGRGKHPSFELTPSSVDFGGIVGNQSDCSIGIAWADKNAISSLTLVGMECSCPESELQLVSQTADTLNFKIVFSGETPRIFAGNMRLTCCNDPNRDLNLRFRGFRSTAPAGKKSAADTGNN